MKITSVSPQSKNQNRANISVDGKYLFSLDIFQVSNLGIKIGNEYSEAELKDLEDESNFGKLYTRSLEYCLTRPHSLKEVRDYLRKKTFTTKYKNRKGELKERSRVSQSIADRVLERLEEKGYVDDQKFASWWVENRHLKKGISHRKLQSELMLKGVDRKIIDKVLGNSTRNEADDLKKVIDKKIGKYNDEKKLIQYLMRQGFRYDDILRALQKTNY
jgi:regulatory protein